MAKKTPGSSSMTDQILEKLFSGLEKHEEFPLEVIEQLRALARQGEFTNRVKIAEILKASGKGAGKDEIN